MYNVRVKRFLDTEQIQVYSTVIQSQRDDRKVDYFTGEVKEESMGSRGEKQYNPFADDCERMVEMSDPERSRSVSHARTIHKIYDIARSNRWEWFVTLTFNKELVKRYDYSDCTKKLSQWLKNGRKICPNMKYIVVPELHKDGAWHFHGLFSDCDGLQFEVAKGHFDDEGRQIYNVGKYKFGWTTAVQIDDQRKTCSYITKYVTKELCGLTKGKKHYWASRNVSLPEVIDVIVESPKEFRRKAIGKSNYCKTVNSEYLDVTYIEMEKGEFEHLL